MFFFILIDKIWYTLQQSLRDARWPLGQKSKNAVSNIGWGSQIAVQKKNLLFFSRFFNNFNLFNSVVNIDMEVIGSGVRFCWIFEYLSGNVIFEGTTAEFKGRIQYIRKMTSTEIISLENTSASQILC